MSRSLWEDSHETRMRRDSYKKIQMSFSETLMIHILLTTIEESKEILQGDSSRQRASASAPFLFRHAAADSFITATHLRWLEIVIALLRRTASRQLIGSLLLWTKVAATDEKKPKISWLLTKRISNRNRQWPTKRRTIMISMSANFRSPNATRARWMGSPTWICRANRPMRTRPSRWRERTVSTGLQVVTYNLLVSAVNGLYRRSYGGRFWVFHCFAATNWWLTSAHWSLGKLGTLSKNSKISLKCKDRNSKCHFVTFSLNFSFSPRFLLQRSLTRWRSAMISSRMCSC